MPWACASFGVGARGIQRRVPRLDPDCDTASPAIYHISAPGSCRIALTLSKEHRDRWNRLYEMNLLDLLVRHAEAEHKRETIASSKRRNCGIWRLMIFLVWKNYVRPKRVRRCAQTPAMLIGLCGWGLTVREILARRLFWARVGLEGRWRQYYWGEVETRALKVNRRHQLKYAA